MGFNVRSNGWPTKALINCTADGVISYGIVQPGQNTNEGVPIVRVNNFKQGRLDVSDVLRVAVSVEDNYKRTRLHGGEVLLTLVGSTGQTAIASSKLAGWNVARAIAVIRPADEIGAKWISICLQSVETKQFLDERANTTVQKTLNLADVKRIPIPLPPEHVRRSIESVFSSLDDKIDLNRRINQTLEAMAQAVFKSWFVDFDPVKAKIAALEQGEDPLRAAMRAISGKTDFELDQMPREHHDQLAATAALFPDAMEDAAQGRANAASAGSAGAASELGEIPKEWEEKSLDQIASYLNGLALQKFPPESEDEYLPVIKIAQLRAGYASGADRASKKIKPEYIVQDGDVLFSWSGSLEVDVWTGGAGALNQHLFKVTSEHAPKWFCYFATKHYLLHFREIAANKATTMGHIQRKHLSEAKIAIPPVDVIKAATEIIDPIFRKMIEVRLQSNQLTQLRDTLLPKLLSGKLSINPMQEASDD